MTTATETRTKVWMDDCTFTNWKFALDTLGLSTLQLRPADKLEYLLGAIAIGLQAPNMGECSTDIHLALQSGSFSPKQLNSTCKEYVMERTYREHLDIMAALSEAEGAAYQFTI